MFAKAQSPAVELRVSRSGELAMLVSQRRIADSLGEVARYNEHKKEQEQLTRKRAASSYVNQAHATLKAY